jgi:hypothetical protein
VSLPILFLTQLVFQTALMAITRVLAIAPNVILHVNFVILRAALDVVIALIIFTYRPVYLHVPILSIQITVQWFVRPAYLLVKTALGQTLAYLVLVVTIF